jgi:hypothetical protein
MEHWFKAGKLIVILLCVLAICFTVRSSFSQWLKEQTTVKLNDPVAQQLYAVQDALKDMQPARRQLIIESIMKGEFNDTRD